MYHTTIPSSEFVAGFSFRSLLACLASGLASEPAQLALLHINTPNIPGLLTQNPALSPAARDALIEDEDPNTMSCLTGSIFGTSSRVSRPTRRPPTLTYTPSMRCDDLLAVLNPTDAVWAVTDLVAPHLGPLGVEAWSLFFTMVTDFQGSIAELVAVITAVTAVTADRTPLALPT